MSPLFQLVVPEYSIHGLFCLMFMCAGEWVTLGLNIPLLFYHLWRYGPITDVWLSSFRCAKCELEPKICFFFFFQVLSPAGRRVRGHVRPRQRDERRHPQLLPEGVLVQTGLLPALFLLLSLQVNVKFTILSFYCCLAGFQRCHLDVL